jgi:hypothetical protein
MRTALLSAGWPNAPLFSFLLIIGLILTINPASAEDGNKEMPLSVIKLVDTKTVGVHEIIWIEVKNLGKWAEQPENDPSKFVLCLNGNEFKGLHPAFRKQDLLGFSLRPTSESTEAWTNLVSQRLKEGDLEEVFVTVRYGSAKIQGEIKAPLRVIDWFWLKVFLTCFVVALIVFVWLAYKTDIIREAGRQPEGINEYGWPNRKPFSLARTQMAWWFFVVLASYIFIWMMTDDLCSLTPSVLALMGISAATGLSSAVVDSSKRTDQENLRRTLEENKRKNELEAEGLSGEIEALAKPKSNAGPVVTSGEQQGMVLTRKKGDLAAKEAEIQQSTRKIQELEASLEPGSSKGFIADILSDEGGISFHRFQMFGWTIVLTVIFVSKVSAVLTMPDFDPMLLALMGISSGTYVGFKLPKQQG